MEDMNSECSLGYVVVNGKIFLSADSILEIIEDCVKCSEDQGESDDFVDGMQTIGEAIREDVTAINIDELLEEFQ